MTKLKFDERQIASILQHNPNGMSVEEICEQNGISRRTYYRWRARYFGVAQWEPRLLQKLAKENDRLRKLTAHLSMLRETDRRRSSR
jgi:putative transposase